MHLADAFNPKRLTISRYNITIIYKITIVYKIIGQYINSNITM